MLNKKIRNFAIIAHIDHGKSTLADRILEITGVITHQECQSQLLDKMEIEQERGITIKLNAVQLPYRYKDQDYILHLIDTPGHVDFSYEVSRSLAACEGALLVVDATQGIEAQTLANLFLALENDLAIIPVINKIDLPNADSNKVTQELIDLLGFKKEEILLVSAKTGIGIENLMEAIIERIPAPKGDVNAPLEALIFDSYYDPYRGVVPLIRVINGKIKIGDNILMMASKNNYLVTSLGIYNPNETKKEELQAGEVGFLNASLKSINDIEVGDTITLVSNPSLKPLAGYKPMKSMVYCGLYPLETSKYPELREALDKLKLNDAALKFEPETSKALGFGFRCGFLGLLHMEIIIERIEREFKISLIATLPSVIYEIVKTDGTVVMIDNPTKVPEQVKIEAIKEPWIRTNILVPKEYIGAIMELCQMKRGNYITMEYIDQTRVNIHYELPLSEIIYDFFEKLKARTKGYATFDYELIGYKSSKLVKMDLLLNGEPIDALSIIIHKEVAYRRGKQMVEQLRKIIPRQQFEIPIQAVIGSKVIARADIKALRKNVLAKCYGGDVSRKRKLLEKQKEGKKRMKMVGRVEVPQEAFLSVLKIDED